MVHEGGWLIPGLVDVHTHPGAHVPGEPLDDDVFMEDLRAHVAAGMGEESHTGHCRRNRPEWAMSDHDLPDRACRALAGERKTGSSPGGDANSAQRVAGPAIEEARRADGWCKLIVDWTTGDGAERRSEPSVPPDVVVEVVRAVHAAGGRVAAHRRHPGGRRGGNRCRRRLTGARHALPLALLDQMASQGTVLMPTMVAFEAVPTTIAALDSPTWMSRCIERGWKQHPMVVRSAFEAGVRAGRNGL